MKRRKKLFTLGICFLLIITQALVTYGNSTVPYQSYTYDYWESNVPTPVPYKPLKSISGEGLGVGKFVLPTDLVVDDEENVYVLDAGNNRIVVFDKNFKLIREISSFDNEGVTDTFNSPNGLCISSRGTLYVADTENHRIVEMSVEGELHRIYTAPEDETLGQDFVFLPMKVTVDSADRVYVVAKNVFQGLISFDDTGKFLGYFGTIKVQVSPIDWFWRLIATKEQRAKMQLFIPTEFTNVDIDDEGFIYATNVDYTNEETIKKLNPSGKNVLINYTNRKIQGDLEFRENGPYSGRSTFTDIKYRDKGIYSALDNTKGKIFTYDSEGHLLYVFGGMGTALGMFKQPVALECKNDNMYVLDKGRGEIVVFTPTDYGNYINIAVSLRFDGDETKAVDYWQEVLKLDANYELAYIGIGKSYLAANRNKEAMEYLKKGMDKQYYSVAFKRYRNEVLKANLSKILTVVLVAIVIGFGVKTYKKYISKGKERKVNA